MIIFNDKFYQTKPKFGRLTVLRPTGKNDAGRNLWVCGCLCGNYTTLTTGEIVKKAIQVRTCGNCKDHEKYKKEYNAWRGMYSRCYNPKEENYKNYGGRGITICQHWRIDFFNFLIDVGLAPSQNHSIDRKDNNGNYEPNNVKWSTRYEQNNNRRDNDHSDVITLVRAGKIHL